MCDHDADPFDGVPADNPHGHYPPQSDPRADGADLGALPGGGVAGLLDSIPRSGVPRGVWCSMSIGDPARAECAHLIEGGALIRREGIAEGVAGEGARVSAADLDAATLAAGYALSLAAMSIQRAAVRTLVDRSRGGVEDSELTDSMGWIARVVSQSDEVVPQATADAERLAAIFCGADGAPIRASDPAILGRVEIVAGCALLDALYRANPALAIYGSSLLLAAINSTIAQVRRAEEEGGAA